MNIGDTVKFDFNGEKTGVIAGFQHVNGLDLIYIHDGVENGLNKYLVINQNDIIM